VMEQQRGDDKCVWEQQPGGCKREDTAPRRHCGSPLPADRPALREGDGERARWWEEVPTRVPRPSRLRGARPASAAAVASAAADCSARPPEAPPCSIFLFEIDALFVWLISHQPAVLFSRNKSATSNQPAVLFSQNKSAPAIRHQPNEQVDGR
jgi:hypothetical protein